MSFGDPWFYVVLLGAAALVYALLLPGRQASSPKNDAAKEMEATLEQYMSEIEKENQELIDLVSQMKQEFASKQLAQQEQIAELRKRLSDVEFSARQSESRLESLAASALENAASASLPAAATAEASLTSANAAVSGQASGLAVLSGTESAAEPAAEPVPETEDNADHVRGRYPELFDLYEKGKSIDMIAKSTGLQRGEVQLILQLAKKEESR
ncbi:hypothetical protein EHV15_22550 [Paenibacillus oralis]|uniref:DUF2802 domain-containing protein n=1 Tax=Paenibacillus oralis TaxID=2490856 RepID=A0A3P3UAA9_9BACL|nr:hypothetical protein [Paenibacillus oralis]RRJ65383.1 hypothetical protein EHV15_22550 [Paenibacillus oralis]